MNFQSLTLAVSRTENLSARPTVLIQILKLYNSAFASARMLEKVIEQDPALSAKVLRVASSSAYGGRKNLSVGGALSVLGMNTVRSIATSLAYQEVINRKRLGAGLDRGVYSRHCLASAVGARAIARVFGLENAEEIYAAALMHEIGVLTLDRFAPTLMGLAVKRAVISERPLNETEREILRYDHYEVGGMVAEKWNLTPMMINAIRFHNNPCNDPTRALETSIVTAGNYLAYQCGFPSIKGISVEADAETFYKELGLSKEQSQKIEDQILAEIDFAERVFGDQSNSDPQKVAA